jgi:hypothetical protein
MKFGLARIIASVALAMAGSSMASANLILDTFERDTVFSTIVSNSTGDVNFSVVNDGATPDGLVEIGFDYVAAGIPLAPRSIAGQGKGVRVTANNVAPAAIDAYTMFHKTPVTVPRYVVSVDVYMGFLPFVAGVQTGQTEFALIGVGGNGTATNRAGTGTNPATDSTGSGSFLAFSGDGGAARDYLWYLNNSTNGGPASGTFAATDTSYLATPLAANGPRADSGLALYNGIFPGTTATNGGFPGNRWTTVEAEVNSETNQVEYRIGGTAIIRGTYTGSLNGLASFGYADFFTSVAAPQGHVFGIFDNFQVTAVPEPSSIALVGLGVLGVVARRRQLSNRKLVT